VTDSTPTVKVDLDELRDIIGSAIGTEPCDRVRIAEAALDSLIAEVRASRAGGWVACSERMPRVGDSVVALGLEDEPLAGKVGPHWRTAGALLLNTATGEGYGFEHVTHWMSLPNPPEERR